MNPFQTKLESIVQTAKEAIAAATDIYSIDQARSQFLGKKGQVTAIMQELAKADPAERPKIGQAVNIAKEAINQSLNERIAAVKTAILENQLAAEAIDITLPGKGQQIGSLHPVTKIRQIFENFFIGMGFSVVEGPEIETDFYNFTALNIPEHHPARSAHDTFYLINNLMLRTQTSPVQIRAMQQMHLPIRIVCPGRVFRSDNDATHAPMFHQMEMLVVDENANFGQLKWIIAKFIAYMFSDKIEYRFRPSFFPFTEPSAECDIKWQSPQGWRWLELGGLGVVHPNVLAAGGIDPERYRGLAFGFGIDRLAMRYYNIPDIRMLFESDLQFLRQF